MKGARMDNDLKIQRKKRLDAACVPDFSRKFNPYDYMEETEINLSELALRITEEKKKEEEQRTRAREFLLIKDEWSEQEVIDLFTHDEVPLMSLICASINAGKLKFLRKHETLYGEPEVYYFEPLVITKWIISKKIPLPNDVLAWYNEQTKQTEVVGIHAITEPKQKELTKLKKQQAAILKVIEAKKFNPMAIPDTEKGTIKLICESDCSTTLFVASTAFDRAWKDGVGKLWKMENHVNYAHRGNN